jgi:hypothetical protein
MQTKLLHKGHADKTSAKRPWRQNSCTEVINTKPLHRGHADKTPAQRSKIQNACTEVMRAEASFSAG